MKKSVWLWQLFGFAFTSLCGTLLHYLYDFSGESRVAALFSAVNESTWEHMKLLFVPLFAFSLLQYVFFRKTESFWWVKLCGTLCGLVLIPVLFYTYNGVFGTSPDWVNIAIFFVSAACAFALEGVLFGIGAHCPLPQWPAFGLMCLIAMVFAAFTFNTPHLPVFRNPISGKYGI